MKSKANTTLFLCAVAVFVLHTGVGLATDRTSPLFNGGMIASVTDARLYAVRNSAALLSCIQAAYNRDGMAEIPYPMPIGRQQPVYWLNPININPSSGGVNSVTIVTSGLLTEWMGTPERGRTICIKIL